MRFVQKVGAPKGLPRQEREAIQLVSRSRKTPPRSLTVRYLSELLPFWSSWLFSALSSMQKLREKIPSEYLVKALALESPLDLDSRFSASLFSHD